MFIYLLDHPPENKESMDTCLKDFKNYILPMTLHWKHKNCYAYLPGGNGFPNIIGDMLSTTLGGIGFSWVSNFFFLRSQRFPFALNQCHTFLLLLMDLVALE